MNKLFIGLLILAAGTGVFFLLRKNKGTQTTETIHKDLLIGKWKDSANHYVFEKEGIILHSLNDSLKADTSYYAWKDNDLVWKENAEDSIGRTFIIQKLVRDSLQLLSKDSVSILLIRVK
jgi:hypothetical protein